MSPNTLVLEPTRSDHSLASLYSSRLELHHSDGRQDEGCICIIVEDGMVYCDIITHMRISICSLALCECVLGIMWTVWDSITMVPVSISWLFYF